VAQKPEAVEIEEAAAGDDKKTPVSSRSRTYTSIFSDN